jgi:hypothetical protein
MELRDGRGDSEKRSWTLRLAFASALPILWYRRQRHLSLCNEEALHEESDKVRHR